MWRRLLRKASYYTVALYYYLFPADGRVYRGRRARAYFDSFSSVASASTWFSVLRTGCVWPSMPFTRGGSLDARGGS
jgi:hypothetical protein